MSFLPGLAVVVLLLSSRALADPVPARGLFGQDADGVDAIPLEVTSGEIFESGTPGGAPFHPMISCVWMGCRGRRDHRSSR
jgi:hypothetical protein